MSYREILREKIDIVAKYRRKLVGWEFAFIAADLADSLFQRGEDLDGAARKRPFREDPAELMWRGVESHSFSWEAGRDICLRQVFRVPEQICGIPVGGSRIHLRSNVVGAPTGVYIDGRKVFQERAWADMQIPEVTLTESAVVGADFEILVRLQNPNAPNKKGVTCLLRLDVEAVEDVLFELETFLSEMDFCASFPERQDILEKAKAAAEAEITKNSSWREDIKSIEKARELMAPLSRYAKKHIVHLVGHAHIDMNWLWTLEDTVDVCRRDFTTMVSIMEENPDFRFSQSQGSVYRITERHFPDLFGKIRKHAEAGRWDMTTAATWTENDLNMSSGESIVRHLLHSRRFMKQRFGRGPRICWQPDTFGHPATVPQILKKAGIPYYFHMRCPPGHRLYRWRGLDGSEIIAYNHTYNGTIRADRIIAVSRELWEGYRFLDAMMVYGVGDHGGGPTRRDIKRINRLNELPAMPRLVFSTPLAYFRKMEEKKDDLPVVHGELNPIFEGCYTTHADIKARNRRCEGALLNAEASTALVSMVPQLGNGPSGGSPRGDAMDRINRGWEDVLFNQFHDILCGCAIRETYDLANQQLDGVLRDTDELVSGNLRRLSPTKTSQQSGQPVVVWNLQGFRRTDVVSVPCPSGDDRLGVVDPRGEMLRCQVYRGRLYFLASDIPSMGYRTYSMVPAERISDGGDADKSFGNAQEISAVQPADGETLRIENDYYILEINRESGGFQRFFDKRLQRELIDGRLWLANTAAAYRRNFNNNLFRVDYEIPQPMAAWIIGPILKTERLLRGATVELEAGGELMDVVKVHHDLGKSRISQEIMLYRDMRRIDFHTRVEWNEESDEMAGAPMLKVEYSPELCGETRACAEIPFGHIRRPADGREYPCRLWVDLSGDDYGFALLNDGKYGYSVAGDSIALTCLRTSHHPDPTADRGEHRFRYALYPHEGGVKEGDVARAAAGFSDPLIPILVGEASAEPFSSSVAHASLPEEGSSRPAEHSWLEVQGSGVMLSAFKPSEHGDHLVLRLCETNGEATRVGVELAFPVSRVEVRDMVEEGTLSRLKLSGQGFRDRLGAFEVKTYLLVRDV